MFSQRSCVQSRIGLNFFRALFAEVMFISAKIASCSVIIIDLVAKLTAFPCWTSDCFTAFWLCGLDWRVLGSGWKTCIFRFFSRVNSEIKSLKKQLGKQITWKYVNSSFIGVSEKKERNWFTKLLMEHVSYWQLNFSFSS